jgi:eukaryotic-like serine/threonine-protein kinase
LLNGARLGPYEIVAPLGQGGMGEVYRARDTKLNRDVAIKILPEAFALDAERVARFQHEAQVLASLNHPNIAGILTAKHDHAGAAPRAIGFRP